MTGQVLTRVAQHGPDGSAIAVCPLPSSYLRRQIALDRVDDRRAVGWLEDDFHYFGVLVEHDGDIIIDVRSRAVRVPWNNCASAATPLRSLIGQRMIDRATDIGSLIDMRTQCTHLFDLAGLVLGHLAGGRRSRHYDVIVPDSAMQDAQDMPAEEEIEPVRLYRDGELVMHWHIRGDDIVGPPDYAGRSMGRGFRAWTDTLDRDQAEQASIIRRAVLVGSGRKSINLYAEGPPRITKALCHSLRPDMLGDLTRQHDNRRRCDTDGAPMITLRSTNP